MKKILFIASLLVFFSSCELFNRNKSVSESDTMSREDSLKVLHDKIYDRNSFRKFKEQQDDITLNADINRDGLIDYILISKTDGVNFGIFVSTFNDYSIDQEILFLPAYSPNSDLDNISPYSYKIENLIQTESGFSMDILKDRGENGMQKEYEKEKRTLFFEYNHEYECVEIVEDNLNTFKNNSIPPIPLEDWEYHWYRRTFMTDKNVISNRTLKMVTNGKELADAIGSNTTIILDAERLEISNHSINSLHSLSNLAILCNNGEHTTLENPFSDIMSITNCKNILLSGIDLRRSESEVRDGSSLSLINCEDIELVACEFSDGFIFESTNKLIATDCKFNIYNKINQSNDLIINNSIFYGHEYNLSISGSKQIDFNQCTFTLGHKGVLDIYNSTNFRFDECIFSGNVWIQHIGMLASSGNIGFSNCSFINNIFEDSSTMSLFKITFSESEEDEGPIVFENCAVGNEIVDFSGDEKVEITDAESYRKIQQIWVKRFDKEKDKYVKIYVDLEEDEPTIIEKYRKRVKRPYQPYD